MEGELMYAHPPRCSSTALPYTKLLKSKLYIFCLCWQLLPSHQRLIRHFGCFTSFVIFLMALSFQSERHWDLLSLTAMPAGKAHPELWSSCKFCLLFLSPWTCTPLGTVSPTFLLRESTKSDGAALFPPHPCKGGLSTLQSTHGLFTFCTHSPC